MDNTDQEVVREPFEPIEEFSSTNCDDNNGISNESEPNPSSKDYSGAGSASVGSSSENLTSIEDEDCNFAKEFGIELKNKKIKPTKSKLSKFDQLLNSEYLITGSTTSKVQPLIKTSVSSDCIYHKGTFYQKGDIVAVCDQDDGQVYFAQITGFLQDQFCEKSASVNWLVPIRKTSREFFDPTAYKIGLDDTQLRKLNSMTFVRHCPHDYYFRRLYDQQPSRDDNLVESRKRSRKEHSYIWTTMDTCIVPTIKSKTIEDEKTVRDKI